MRVLSEKFRPALHRYFQRRRLPPAAGDGEEALDLLSEVGEGYQKAEKTYDEAQNLANAHPKLIEAAPE